MGLRKSVAVLSSLVFLWTACARGAPSTLLTPAPTECELGLSREQSLPAKELPERIAWHLPRWLPGGFGLARSNLTIGGHASAIWTDRRCRELEVRISTSTTDEPEGQRIGDWWVEYNVPGGCGNPTLGTARCLGYAARVDEGWLRVYMLGVDRPEGDRIVLSIPT